MTSYPICKYSHAWRIRGTTAQHNQQTCIEVLLVSSNLIYGYSFSENMRMKICLSSYRKYCNHNAKCTSRRNTTAKRTVLHISTHIKREEQFTILWVKKRPTGVRRRVLSEKWLGSRGWYHGTGETVAKSDSITICLAEQHMQNGNILSIKFSPAKFLCRISVNEVQRNSRFRSTYQAFSWSWVYTNIQN